MGLSLYMMCHEGQSFDWRVGPIPFAGLSVTKYLLCLTREITLCTSCLQSVEHRHSSRALLCPQGCPETVADGDAASPAVCLGYVSSHLTPFRLPAKQHNHLSAASHCQSSAILTPKCCQCRSSKGYSPYMQKPHQIRRDTALTAMYPTRGKLCMPRHLRLQKQDSHV